MPLVLTIIRPSRKILCESPSQTKLPPGYLQSPDSLSSRNLDTTRVRGKLDYQQLTFGSFLGLVTGFVFGRVSKYLVTLFVSTVMGIEYLKSTGYVDLTPVYRNIYNFSKRHLHQAIAVDDASFKYSFAISFLISAFNS